MLFELEPSSAITGGPWYTDSELDTEFIKLLMDACMKFIREKVIIITLRINWLDSNTSFDEELSERERRRSVSYFCRTGVSYHAAD